MNNLLKNESVKWGLYLGLALSLLSVLHYNFFISLKLGSNLVFALVMMLLYIIFTTIGAKNKRTAIGGYWSYGMAVSNVLLISFIGSAISAIFYFVYMNYLDVETAQKVYDIQLEQMNRSLEEYPSKFVEQSLVEMEKKGPGVTVKETIMGILVSPIIGLLYALIAAIFLKKEKPMFES